MDPSPFGEASNSFILEAAAGVTRMGSLRLRVTCDLDAGGESSCNAVEEKDLGTTDNGNGSVLRECVILQNDCGCLNDFDSIADAEIQLFRLRDCLMILCIMSYVYIRTSICCFQIRM